MAETFGEGYRYSSQRSILEAQTLPAKHFRSDIQGLRAVAVLAVLLSHIWPAWIPGGFVGVDVFFVISGYLITGLLFRELQQTGRIALLQFYVRRMKRLLPAATLVLLIVAIFSIWLLPPSRWEETAIEIAASAFYLENWRLAWLAVDYFGAENTASPVQHYWSLSIEEQFYIVWPLLMIAAGAVLSRFVGLRTAVMIPLVLIVAMSFAASVYLTEARPEQAYFLTHTRIWQLALGGLLAIAVLPEFTHRAREAMRAIGLAGIVLAVFGFSGETAFPGYAALLPTLGCALIIASGTGSDAGAMAKFLGMRPAQYLGDISYSIYLWHWPIIIFAGLYARDGIDLLLGLTLIAATIAMAHLSKNFVEDPIRYSRIDAKRTFALAAAVVASCIIGAAAIYHHFALHVVNAYADSPDYPGARAFFAGAPVPSVDSPMPPLIFLKKDKAEVYKEDCHSGDEETALTPCIFGPDAGRKVVLTGDSHAANWAPALISKVDEMGWRLETHTRSSCPVIRETVWKKDKQGGLYCREWVENLLQHLQTSKPDLVLFAQSRFHKLAKANGQESRKEVGAAVASVWRELLSLGIRVVAIRDTPKLSVNPGECISRDPGCFSEQSKVIGDDDPIVIARSLVPEVPVIDMTDAVCQNGKCPMVVGNVIVWRDSHHLTASYARTLATPLIARIVDAAGGLKTRLSRQ